MAGSIVSASSDAGGRCLLTAPNWIGDCVMALPAIRAWREEHPDAVLDILCRAPVAGFWPMAPGIGDVLTTGTSLADMRATAAVLRDRGYRQAFILPNSFRSALPSWLARIPTRRGFAGGLRTMLLTDPVPRSMLPVDAHQSEEMLVILHVEGEVNRPLPRLEIPPEVEAEAEALLDGCRDGCVLGMIPGAARGPSKRWPPDRFADVANRVLAARPGVVVLTGGPGDREICAEVAGRIDGRSLNLAGRTSLPTWAAILRLCDAVVCNDSGGMHVAAAVGTPLVAVFGMTDPSKTGPLGENSRVVQASGIRSRAIRRDSEAARKSLEAVTSERVYGELSSLLAAVTSTTT